MEKQRWEESEKRKEERRSEKRKSQKKEDAGAWKGRKVAKQCVFPMSCGSEGRQVGSLKRRVRSHLGRWEMKNCTPLWCEAHFEVKMYKTLQLQNTFRSCVDVQSSFCVARARDSAPCQPWAKREGLVGLSKTMAHVGHLKRICIDAFRLRSTGDIFIKDVGWCWEGLHFGASDRQVC